jgi:hypothetical protein
LTPRELAEAVISASGDLRPDSLVRYARVMRYFAAFLESRGVTDAAQTAMADVEAFVRIRRGDGELPSLALMHFRRSVLRHLFHGAVDLGVEIRDHTSRMDLAAREARTPPALTDKEIALAEAYACADPEDLRRPLALALAEATARSSEISKVRVCDVEGTLVHLLGSARCAPRWVELTDWGVGQVDRRLAFSPDPAEALVPLRSPTSSAASMALLEVLRRAGLSGAKPMSVVAWRARHELGGGRPLELVASILGTRSLDRAAEIVGLHRPTLDNSQVGASQEYGDNGRHTGSQGRGAGRGSTRFANASGPSPESLGTGSDRDARAD